MGYCTYFEGSFVFDKKPSDGFIKYLKKFSEVRHMKRDVKKIKEYDPNWRDKCFEGDLGVEGCYYVGGGNGYYDDDPSIIETNYPPIDVPGLWCDWTISDDGMELIWDEGEKFYNYVDWLEYLIEHFIEPCGYKINGEITWEGEERDDNGKIVVVNNVVTVQEGFLLYSEEDMRQKVLEMVSDEELIKEVRRRFLEV